MVVMSHLSDAQEIVTYNPQQANVHINFAKYLISTLKGDLMQDIDADELWSDFEKIMEFRGVLVKKKTIECKKSDGTYVDAEILTQKECEDFFTGDVKEKIVQMILADKENKSLKLKAILVLKQIAVDQGKHIGLKEAKDLIWAL